MTNCALVLLASRLLLRHELLQRQPNKSGQKRRAAMWLLAVRRQRKQSRSNIKNDSSNYPPCTPRDAISHMCVHPRTCLCVCVCVCAQFCVCGCVCVSTGMSAMLYLFWIVLQANMLSSHPISLCPAPCMFVVQCKCECVSVWAYLNEI